MTNLIDVDFGDPIDCRTGELIPLDDYWEADPSDRCFRCDEPLDDWSSGLYCFTCHENLYDWADV